MKHMSLQEIAAACGGTYHGSPVLASREVSSVEWKKTAFSSR